MELHSSLKISLLSYNEQKSLEIPFTVWRSKPPCHFLFFYLSAIFVPSLCVWQIWAHFICYRQPLPSFACNVARDHSNPHRLISWNEATRTSPFLWYMFNYQLNLVIIDQNFPSLSSRTRNTESLGSVLVSVSASELNQWTWVVSDLESKFIKGETLNRTRNRGLLQGRRSFVPFVWT